MPLRHVIQPPRLWPAEAASSRRVTWLELFFDLIFVAAVAQVDSPLSVNYSLAGVFRFLAFFVLIWWAWVGHTLYSTRFDTDDLVQRLLTLIQIFAVAAMAANKDNPRAAAHLVIKNDPRLDGETSSGGVRISPNRSAVILSG